MHGLMITVVAAAAACLLIGAARIAAWVMDRREEAATRPARQQDYVLQASLEVCHLAADREFRDLPAWTQTEEDAYQRSRAREREIAASKRGDLLAAACFAELSEVDRG